MTNIINHNLIRPVYVHTFCYSFTYDPAFTIWIPWSIKFTKHIILWINPSCQRKIFHAGFDSLIEASLLELLTPISSLKWG